MAGVDTGRIERAVHEILLAIGEDPERPGLERTPQRVAEAYADFFGGLSVDPLTHLADAVPLGDTEAGVPATSDAVVLRDIAFRSVSPSGTVSARCVSGSTARPPKKSA